MNIRYGVLRLYNFIERIQGYMVTVAVLTVLLFAGYVARHAWNVEMKIAERRGYAQGFKSGLALAEARVQEAKMGKKKLARAVDLTKEAR